MTTHEFTIIATGLDPQADDFEDRFYAAGCDDAVISFQKGLILIDFAREAEDAAQAIASACNDIVEAGAVIKRVEPDPLVNLSDIASRSGLTRAAISNYASGLRGEGFPSPVVRVTSDSPLWSWREVSCWLVKTGRVEEKIRDIALTVEAANIGIQHQKLIDPTFLREYSRKIHECA